MPVRRAPLVGLAAAGLLTLSGCEKPAPAVTVQSGGSTDRVEATCWSFEPAEEAQGCEAGGETGSLAVRPGEVVGISVDGAVADAGWVVQLDGQPQNASLTDSTYFSLRLPEALPAQSRLQVFAATEGGEPDQQRVRGAWQFTLERG